MTVPGAHAKSVVDDNQPAVAGVHRSFNDHAIGCGPHAFTIFRGDIDSSMKCTLTAEWIKPLAEGGRNTSDYRPKSRAESHLAQTECGHQSRAVVGYRLRW